MTDELVLITGATGFIGYNVLVVALKAGYHVRCAIRSKSGINKILAEASIKGLTLTENQLTWIIVPDITAPHAYDEAVEKVTYILHCASPVPSLGQDTSQGTDDEVYIQPAIRGVTGMLESGASQASQSLKRIVITSSVVAIIPHEHFHEPTNLDRPAFNAESRVPDASAPYVPPFGAYAASKINALNATDTWMEKHNPSFDLINIMPAWVYGRDEMSTTVNGLMDKASALLIQAIKGNKTESKINEAIVSVDDVAKAHVLALNPEIDGSQSFILGKLENFAEGVEFARETFPEAYQNGTFKEGGVQPTIRIPMDASKTETVLGLRLVPFKNVVKDCVDQYLELQEKLK